MYDEAPDYAALKEDIRNMLFDQEKFEKLFIKAFNNS